MPQAKISRISERLTARGETVVVQGALASFEKLMSHVNLSQNLSSLTRYIPLTRSFLKRQQKGT